MDLGPLRKTRKDCKIVPQIISAFLDKNKIPDKNKEVATIKIIEIKSDRLAVTGEKLTYRICFMKCIGNLFGSF